MNITKYIFSPRGRVDTDDMVSNSGRALAARHAFSEAEKVEFVSEPLVGFRAVFTIEDGYDRRTIATSTLRGVNFDEAKGVLDLKTMNSIYSFSVVKKKS